MKYFLMKKIRLLPLYSNEAEWLGNEIGKKKIEEGSRRGKTKIFLFKLSATMAMYLRYDRKREKM